MADESIDESLKTCIRLMHGVMFDNWTGEGIANEERWEYRVLYDPNGDPNGVVVGAIMGSSMTTSDDERQQVYYGSGRGPTLLSAIADWRARLAKGAKKKMAEHEAFRRYVEERGLLR